MENLISNLFSSSLNELMSNEVFINISSEQKQEDYAGFENNFLNLIFVKAALIGVFNAKFTVKGEYINIDCTANKNSLQVYLYMSKLPYIKECKECFGDLVFVDIDIEEYRKIFDFWRPFAVEDLGKMDFSDGLMGHYKQKELLDALNTNDINIKVVRNSKKIEIRKYTEQSEVYKLITFVNFTEEERRLFN